MGKKTGEVASIETAERRADGQRVQRFTDANGHIEREWEATVFVEQQGSIDTGNVLLKALTGMARTDFEIYLNACREAGGKFQHGAWRLPADAGWKVAEALRDDGFKVEVSKQLAANAQLHAALLSKFGLQTSFEATVNVGASGFMVGNGDIELPCTVGEALLLDEAGARFMKPALLRIKHIRDAAGFANEGCGEAVQEDDPFMQSIDPFAAGSGPARAAIKVGRNEPCPCGSNKKFKKCCEGQQDAQ